MYCIFILMDTLCVLCKTFGHFVNTVIKNTYDYVDKT